jgi:hypothetical protein
MEHQQTNKLKNDVRNFILNGNSKYPIDLWWREKHNIPFGSKIHKDICFIDMMIEYEEDRMRFYQENPEKVAEIIQSKEVDKDFEDFDIENYNSNE